MLTFLMMLCFVWNCFSKCPNYPLFLHYSAVISMTFWSFWCPAAYGCFLWRYTLLTYTRLAVLLDKNKWSTSNSRLLLLQESAGFNQVTQDSGHRHRSYQGIVWFQPYSWSFYWIKPLENKVYDIDIYRVDRFLSYSTFLGELGCQLWDMKDEFFEWKMESFKGIHAVKENWDGKFFCMFSHLLLVKPEGVFRLLNQGAETRK